MSKEYWIKRAMLREEAANKIGEQIAGEVLSIYRGAHREILSEISFFYEKYATKHGLSYADAVKLLSRKEFAEWKRSIEEYVEQIRRAASPAEKELLTAVLDARSARSQISRLDAIKTTIESVLTKAGAEIDETVHEGLATVYHEGYYRTMYDVQSRVQRSFPFELLSQKAIDDALAFPWSGSTFSTRIWENQSRLASILQQELTRGLIGGKSVAQMSKTVAENMGRSYKRAETLVRTESNRAHSDAARMAFEEAGVEYYEYVATLDHRTSSICAGLDAKIFKVKDAVEGENYPPMHPNCRSTTVEHDPDEWQDWEAIGEPMPKRKTYQEWYNEQTAKHGEGYVENLRKKEYNYSKDLNQFRQYRDDLGSNMPFDFEKFRDLKHDNSEEYAVFKSYIRGIKTGELTALADFPLYKETRTEIEHRLLGLVTSTGTEITGYSDHFMNRVIGSVSQRRNGVAISDVSDALLKPTKLVERRNSTAYHSDKVVVSVNPITRILIQVNPNTNRRK